MLHRVWIVVVGISIVFGFSEVWLQRSTVVTGRTMAFPSSHITTSVLDAGTSALPRRDGDWADPRVDLNGNEIDAAVGDYTADTRGEMYERHAPDTALIHLSAPTL